MARFLECAVVSNWLPHTPVQIFFRLILVHKTVWCSLSSSSIQTGVLAGTFCITLLWTETFCRGALCHEGSVGKIWRKLFLGRLLRGFFSFQPKLGQVGQDAARISDEEFRGQQN